MARYTGPGVTVDVLLNPRIINVATTDRFPAIIGMGPTVVNVVDEAVVAGEDTLAHTNVTFGQITQIAKIPNYSASAGTANLYVSGVDYTSIASGVITWAIPPTAGSVYYVTYTYSVTATQLEPQLFFNKKDIEATYGAEGAGIVGAAPVATCGNLTIAGNLALENGAPAVYLCQVATGSTITSTNYINALAKLEKLQNIGKVCAVFPANASGSFTYSDMGIVHSQLLAHCEAMSTPEAKKEREAIIGDAPTATMSGGHDTIGTESTDPSYIYKAHSFESKRVIYVAPSSCTRNGMTLDANYMAAGIAGMVLSKDKVHASTPITGKQLQGVTITNDKWTDTEKDYLGSYGITVLESSSNVVIVRHALTTNMQSAETAEDSVVQQEDLVKRTLRTGLDNVFKGKGRVIDDTLIYDVATTVKSIMASLVRDQDIRAYGQKTNPLTGEVPISVEQDLLEPRTVNVTLSYAPLYPLVWVKVTASTYVS